MEVIQNTFNGIASVLDSAMPELRAAAEHYRKETLQAAIELDRTLPESGEYCPTAIEHEIAVCPPLPFSDSRMPEQHLKKPDLEPEGPVNKLGWMDYISPTAWMMKGFDIILGFDPVQEVQNKLVGDWEMLAQMQQVLTNASTAVHDLAYNIQAGATALHGGYWEGNAGEQAHRYFTDFATSVDQLRAPLAKMGEEYRTMANAVWEAGDAIGGLIKGICDAAIIAGVAAAAGTATSLTGGGAVVGYGVAAAEAANMLAMWAQVTKYLAYADSAVKGFRSLLDSSLSDLDEVELSAIGGGAGYDHPLAGAGAHV
ncbi:uncharacterized protein YukE [Actinoplanes campanulatus]|uniref:Uncharacterized protein YukE n=1 Tax=Actinoplanes campanulatus TaxID=113559 RepID=A0A7W5ADW4_9ACTN|nr:hypothetical protein [Actinoplanes campanulatus]MBB3094383.1 uncharacterized protein YukE [Actinoplanes campanulatus]GGN20680.1 hypothetical protein GCM10010109_34480 [Actinoplanes campanulatus]GID35702.1 hypothetical protein Aca09nite_22080 [Actinoplanes campanulatus]